MSKRKFWELENPAYKITYEVVKQNGRKYRLAKARRRGLSAKDAFLAPLESTDLSGLDFTDPALEWIWSKGECRHTTGSTFNAFLNRISSQGHLWGTSHCATTQNNHQQRVLKTA